MARSGRRVRLAKGIFKDATGLAVVVRVHGQPKEFRLPLTTRLQAAKNAQTEYQLELQERLPAAATAGTLAADVAAYVAKLPDGRAKQDRAQLLKPWVDVLGDHAFSVITGHKLSIA